MFNIVGPLLRAIEAVLPFSFSFIIFSKFGPLYSCSEVFSMVNSLKQDVQRVLKPLLLHLERPPFSRIQKDLFDLSEGLPMTPLFTAWLQIQPISSFCRRGPTIVPFLMIPRFISVSWFGILERSKSFSYSSVSPCFSVYSLSYKSIFAFFEVFIGLFLIFIAYDYPFSDLNPINPSKNYILHIFSFVTIIFEKWSCLRLLNYSFHYLQFK